MVERWSFLNYGSNLTWKLTWSFAFAYNFFLITKPFDHYTRTMLAAYANICIHYTSCRFGCSARLQMFDDWQFHLGERWGFHWLTRTNLKHMFQLQANRNTCSLINFSCCSCLYKMIFRWFLQFQFSWINFGFCSKR